jgi:hypothetical protein
MNETSPASEPASPPPAPAVAPAAARPGLLERLSRAATPVRVGLLIALALATFLTASLSGYGVTSDTPALFYSGDRTLFWLQHPTQPGALDYLSKQEPQGFVTKFGREPDWYDPLHYPVFPGFVGALSNWVFHVKLQWLDHIDGHHLGLVWLNAVALFLFCLYACALLGRGAGIAATLVLALFPVAVGKIPNDAKDWPCAMFYALAVLATGRGILQEKPRQLLMAGVFLGLSMAAKANAAFILVTVLLWTPVAWAALYRRQKPLPGKMIQAWFAAPFIGLAVFVFSWPWLYYGGPAQWWEHLFEYVKFMANYGAGVRPGPTSYPFMMLALTTPPLVLAAALAYWATGFKTRPGFALWSLHLIWVLIPLARIAAPKSNFYDGNRHFIEYVPAVASAAGMGIAWAFRKLAEWTSRPEQAALLSGRLPKVGTASLAGVLAVALVWPVAEYHPYESVYWNVFIGGLGGAQRRAMTYFPPPGDIRVLGTEGDYWFSSARQGARDLRALLKPGEKISMCGPGRGHAMANWAVDPIPHMYEAHEPDFPFVDYMFISPRETLCWWRQIRRFESERPVIKRVERGGGLVYEILGRKDGKKRVPPSPETWYERHPDPRDNFSWFHYEP